MGRRERSGVRPEIQALRALAVLTVVAYHVWPEIMPGGFVGVDVFFAISGFLITAQLLREMDARGTVSLWGFWARRARRLLPAALLTLLVCAAGTILLVPQLYWPQFLTEIGTSTAYVQNWQLAADAVDYLAAENRASPVQHFWTLSVEEQFYVFWPLLILLGTWASRRRLAIAGVLLAVTGLSLWYSISETAANPAAAYFVTPTRAWEFGAGGLLALLGTRALLPDGLRALLSWAGLAAIGYAGVAYSAATAFPGWAAALPVGGALAVMYAGMPAAGWAPSRLLALRPAQFLGDVSYSAYLWHWPLLVFAPFAIADLGTVELRVAVPLLTVALAWVTKVLVEDPVRRSQWLAAQPRMTFAMGAAATAVLALVLAGGTTHVEAQIRKAERVSSRVAADVPRCFGAAARDPARPCESRKLRRKVVPLPVAAADERNAPCEDFRTEHMVSVCDFGVTPARAARTVALVGDSHASHWRAALDVVARERNWHGLSMTRTSCAFSTVARVIPEPTRAECVRWVRRLPRVLRDHPEIDTVFVSAITGSSVRAAPGQSVFAAEVEGFRDAWRSLPDTVRRIVVIRDTPRITSSTVDCIDRAIGARRRPGLACAVPRSAALARDPQVVAARGMRSPEVHAVDLSDVLCSARLCYPVIGGALVFKDLHHFTRVFAETLGAPLGRELSDASRDW